MAADVDQHAADAGVEAVAQVDALGLSQRVLVQRLARELQERAVDLRGQSAAGEQVRLVALVGACGVVEPPRCCLLYTSDAADE